MLETRAPRAAAATCPNNRTAQLAAEPPALAPGVELVGEMPGTGFQERQWLAVRNGQFVQLTEILFRICEQCDGSQTLQEIADAVTNRSEWFVQADIVQRLIEKKLAPIGLVLMGCAEVEPLEVPARSPLSLQLRTRILSSSRIEPVTRLMRGLFAPVLLVPMLILVVGAHVWLYRLHGISASLEATLTTPGLLLLLLPILFAGLAFHELGHACALSYGGGRTRGMGMGLYLVFPAFFTDTTDAYRLGRTARLRTDLGGFYFHAIFALGLIGLYVLTGQEFLLLAVLLIDVDVVYQCLPFVRLDGYWALADITGIPDFFALMGPFIASISPLRRHATRLPALRPFARRVFVLYILLVIPVLVVLGVLALTQIPWLLTTTWTAETLQQQLLAHELDAGNPVLAALSLLQMLLLLGPVLGSLYLLFSLGSPAIQFVYRRIGSRSKATGPFA